MGGSFSNERRNLVIKYATVTLSTGLFFLVVHILLGNPGFDTSYLRLYFFLVPGYSILVYLLYFKKELAAADFKGDGKYYLPLVYFLGNWFIPIPFLYLTTIDYSSSQRSELILLGVYLIIAVILFVIFRFMVKAGDDDWGDWGSGDP